MKHSPRGPRRCRWGWIERAGGRRLWTATAPTPSPQSRASHPCTPPQDSAREVAEARRPSAFLSVAGASARARAAALCATKPRPNRVPPTRPGPRDAASSLPGGVAAQGRRRTKQRPRPRSRSPRCAYVGTQLHLKTAPSLVSRNSTLADDGCPPRDPLWPQRRSRRAQCTHFLARSTSEPKAFRAVSRERPSRAPLEIAEGWAFAGRAHLANLPPLSAPFL